MLNTASKMTLKLTCLQQTNGDVKRAEELYKFLADGMDNMPEYPIPQPTAFQQVKDTASNIFGWVKENQGDIINAVNYIQQLRSGQSLSVPTPPISEIPPLPNPR